MMQAEYLRRRNALVQVIEELKMTRITNKENEKRIDKLVREKHEIESKCFGGGYGVSSSRSRRISQRRFGGGRYDG